MEKCSDPLDTASQMQDQANESALAQRRATEARRMQKVRQAIDDGDFDGVHCIECEIEIPLVRIAMLQMHCTACAQVIENQNKRMGI